VYFIIVVSDVNICTLILSHNGMASVKSIEISLLFTVVCHYVIEKFNISQITPRIV